MKNSLEIIRSAIAERGTAYPGASPYEPRAHWSWLTKVAALPASETGWLAGHWAESHVMAMRELGAAGLVRLRQTAQRSRPL